MKPILLAAAALVLLPRLALADCEHTKNDFDDVYCLAKIYINADGDLNDAYKSLVAKLNAEQKKSLKSGQVAWIKQRNESCGQAESDGYYVDLDCAVTTTRKRSDFLIERRKECEAGACDAQRLGEIE